jgi:hypothetical protein
MRESFLFTWTMEEKMDKKLASLFKQAALILMLTLLAGLAAACSSASQEAPAAPPNYAAESSAVQSTAVPADAAVSSSEPVPMEGNILSDALAQAQGPRVIIYSGDMALVVKDTQATVEAITNLANELGGYVAGANIYQSDGAPRGTITIRVPAEQYENTVTRLRQLALRVESESTNTPDVTEEFVDLEARKTNLEHTETALQTLLDERQRVGQTSDILEVYRELTNIRGQIEQIEGRMRYLANQAALSSIVINLTPDVLYQPVSIAGWEPQGVAKEALQALVTALQGLINLAIWLIILVLPLLIILLLPVVVVIVIIRWWWKRRSAKKMAAPTPKAEIPTK